MRKLGATDVDLLTAGTVLSSGSGASFSRNISFTTNDGQYIKTNQTISTDLTCDIGGSCGLKVNCAICGTDPCWAELSFTTIKNNSGSLDFSGSSSSNVKKVLRNLKCDATGIVESSFLNAGSSYHVRLTPQSAVQGLRFSGDNSRSHINELAVVNTTGSFGATRQALSVTFPYRTPLYGFYDYVIFTEESLVKNGPLFCGNGVVDPDEQCDYTVMVTRSCVDFNSLAYESGTLGCKNDCTYDTSGCVPIPWHLLSSGIGMSGQSAIWTGAQMILVGGTAGLYPYVYDPFTTSWIGGPAGDINPFNNPHGAFWNGTRMIYADISGFTLFDPYNSIPPYTGGSWSPGIDASCGWMDGRSIVYTGHSLIYYGGIITGADVALSNNWIEVSTNGSLPASRSGNITFGGRAYHSAVWDGTRMYYWGGRVGSTYTYNLSDTGGYMTPMGSVGDLPSPSGALSARQYHKAFWTGSKMIIWGGEDTSGTPLNNGAIYDPSGGWVRLPDPPSGLHSRTGYYAVWTGSTMIIWGGSHDGIYYNDGAIYDLPMNSWFYIAPIPGVAPRSDHSAVWAPELNGGSMIVWGGRDASESRMSDGFTYTPN